jgi:hypothetical protein
MKITLKIPVSEQGEPCNEDCPLCHHDGEWGSMGCSFGLSVRQRGPGWSKEQEPGLNCPQGKTVYVEWDAAQEDIDI